MKFSLCQFLGLAVLIPFCVEAEEQRFERVPYNTPDQTADLGVGLWGWPMPCDRNGDGLPDLIVASSASPYKGVYYFENTGKKDPKTGMDLFQPAKRLGDAKADLTASYTPEGMRVLTPGMEYPDFLKNGAGKGVKLPVDPKQIHETSGRIRGNQWSYVDYDGDGKLDLVVGIGDWTDYGWENAYDENGRWTNGPLHGFVYILRNEGTNEKPIYGKPFRLEADGRPIDVYGIPSPVFADFMGTGKLDLVCGEFVDGLTFFENIGTREKPKYAPGRRLTSGGKPITMPLAMIVVAAYDWNKDKRPDLVVAQEDGRVALLENTGRIVRSGRGSDLQSSLALVSMPEFQPPRFFRQKADDLKFQVLTTPVSVDWDADGLPDLLTGNTAGEIAFIKNLGGQPSRWSEPVLLEADGEPIRIMAGYNGSIQGPAESKWGYTNIGVGDWNGDGRPDLLTNTILGKILWFENIGTASEPKLAAAKPIQVDWKGATPKPAWNWWNPEPGELVTQWRCTPYVIDLDGDGINDLVTVDHEGYLAFFRQVERDGKRVLLPGERIFQIKGPSEFNHIHEPIADGKQNGPLRLNGASAGKSGRRTFCFADWDGDGKLDLLVNSTNINFLRNISTKPGEWLFEDQGRVDGRKLAGHSTSPTTVDWDRNGVPDLLVGAEDGFFYHLENPIHSKSTSIKTNP